jgi:undecaprenyl-diphosphatase
VPSRARPDGERSIREASALRTFSMPTWISALVLGLIEGLTEFIPVSSTGHLLIAEKWLGTRSDVFNALIQVGAAVALLPLFWPKLVGIVRNWSLMESRDFVAKLVLSFLITVAGGLVLKKLDFELPKTVGPVAWATLVGGVAIFVIEAARKGRPGDNHITWTVAIALGLAQLLAVYFPGTSRSGATIMIALGLGLARPVAAEFSFILGMITLAAAGSYELLDALKDGGLDGAGAIDLSLGFLAAAVSAFIVVKWLLRFVQHHTFNGFAVYRVILGLVLLVFFQ